MRYHIVTGKDDTNVLRNLKDKVFVQENFRHKGYPTYGIDINVSVRERFQKNESRVKSKKERLKDVRYQEFNELTFV